MGDWVGFALGGGGFIALLGGVVKTVLMLGQVLQKLEDHDERMDRADERQDKLESRIDNLTNGRRPLATPHPWGRPT
jgi:hypothetical protein